MKSRSQEVVDQLRKEALKTPFDVQFFDRESVVKGIAGVGKTWQERFQAAVVAASKKPPSNTPSAVIDGWALALGYEVRNNDTARWHLLVVAVPYRRPIYNEDWESLGGILDRLGVPEAVVQAEVDHWGVDHPFAPFRFVWEDSQVDPPSNAPLLLKTYCWTNDWTPVVQLLREEALSKVMSLTEAAALESMARKEKLEAALLEGVAGPSEELLERTRASHARIILNGWSIVAAAYKESSGRLRWQLSLKLHPFGRSSTDRDWTFFGAVAGAFGAPQDRVVEAHARNPDPNAAYHVYWTEAGS